MKISAVMATARDDFPIMGLPDVHIFQPTLESLENQTFKDFELIIVDALYPKRKPWVRKWSFPIKYVPAHPKHRFWLDKGLWNVAGMLNTGLLYCEGELVVRLDDCCEIPDENYLKRIWANYQSGYFPLAMHVRYHAGRPARVNKEYLRNGYEAKCTIREVSDRAELLKNLYGEGGIVRDTRWPTVEKYGQMIAPPEWFYGYSSFSLGAALKINGFNELFDGLKGQEDQDFGIRLYELGYRFLLNKDLWVIEHEHLPPVVLSPDPFKCNYGIILYEKTKRLNRANDWNLTLDDCNWIRKNICLNCLNYQRCLNEKLSGKFYIEGDLFNLWIANQNNFDLRGERNELGL